MTSQFTVGLVTKGKADRVVVDADDALIAALKVKTERPEATITYVRRQNRRGDARHPAHALADRRWRISPWMAIRVLRRGDEGTTRKRPPTGRPLMN